MWLNDSGKLNLFKVLKLDYPLVYIEADDDLQGNTTEQAVNTCLDYQLNAWFSSTSFPESLILQGGKMRDSGMEAGFISFTILKGQAGTK